MLKLKLKLLLASASVASAVCPYMSGGLDARSLDNSNVAARAEGGAFAKDATEEFFQPYYLDDSDSFLTSDVGGPIEDQSSLSIGERGPTLLEDFIFRQKIQRFDHERVPERVVHARGAGAHGVFTSYGNYSNITAASFLSGEGKETPVFVRFSTVAGSRGSADTARDVHGFATRFYTDEGNFDLVGNNIPVFFIQDAIQFPDLIHAVKPKPDREIPQAATAHDSAWDFFSSQPSTMHTLFWAMSGHGIPRSFRHVDGFGVHTYRLVTDSGASKLVKFHWKTLQGKASLVWEEAQALAGKNADMHRQDLFEAIDAGRFPEWELCVQIMDEEDQLRFGFDLLDPTKLVPEDLVPLTKLGKMQLNRNPRNYFSETEQVMFQPGHIVRGIDFTEDPLLQGRLFSYLDTQLNRNGGPNFEQLPVNQPRVPIHNNNRDGAGQMYIPLNSAAYSPNTLNSGSPRQATQNQGRGFFTAPERSYSGKLQRTLSKTFMDAWSQPRFFYNSLSKMEKQFVVNALRFETSKVSSQTVRENTIKQLNRISNNIAVRVARAIGVSPPSAATGDEGQYYHNNKSSVPLGAFGTPLLKLSGLKVCLLSSNSDSESGVNLAKSFIAADPEIDVLVVEETLPTEPSTGVSALTYSAADGSECDAVIAMHASGSLFNQTLSAGPVSPLFPASRPSDILSAAYRYGKPIGALGTGRKMALSSVGLDSGPSVERENGVFVRQDETGGEEFVKDILDGLRTFRFLRRFAIDGDADDVE